MTTLKVAPESQLLSQVSVRLVRDDERERFDAALRAVLGLESRLNHVELERAHDADHRIAAHGEPLAPLAAAA